MSDVIKNLDPQKVRLGVTPTLWWNDDFPSIDVGISFGQCVSEMALAGFQGCSVGHKYPTDPTVLKSALDLRGLRVSEPWVSTYFTINSMEQQTIDAFENQLAFIQAMGGTDLVVAEFGRSSHLRRPWGGRSWRVPSSFLTTCSRPQTGTSRYGAMPCKPGSNLGITTPSPS